MLHFDSEFLLRIKQSQPRFGLLMRSFCLSCTCRMNILFFRDKFLDAHGFMEVQQIQSLNGALSKKLEVNDGVFYNYCVAVLGSKRKNSCFYRSLRWRSNCRTQIDDHATAV